MQTKVEKREIDRIVDGLVKDDTLAKALKQKLHDKMDAPAKTYARAETASDQSEDLWDNMPV